MVTRTGLDITLYYTASLVCCSYQFRLLNELYVKDNWDGRLYQFGILSQHY